MTKKYLTPLQIEFLYWYIDELQRKHIDTFDFIIFIRQVIENGYYREQDSESLNKMVKINKQGWLWRNTGPVQRLNKNGKT